MKQNKLDELMKNRNPLTQREPVIPADMYTTPQVNKPTNGQDDLSTKPQVGLPTKPETDLPTNLQNDKPTINEPIAAETMSESTQVHKTTSGQAHKRLKPQTDKATKPRLEKYTTHLEPAVIKAIKRFALDHDLKDYQVMQSAIEKYLKDK